MTAEPPPSAPNSASQEPADGSTGGAAAIRRAVLAKLTGGWPPAWRVSLPPAGTPLQAVAHPLGPELAAFWNGEAASLPYVPTKHDLVQWVTVAPGSEALQASVDVLRAWVLPSFAWEHQTQPFVMPGSAAGSLSAALLALSPAGYFRWTSTREGADRIAEKLRTARALRARRPEHLHEQVPSLYELRQQFRLALIAGDRDAADQAIRSIDHHQLDHATNTQLMRVRLRDAFGAHAEIARDPAVGRLVPVRMPPAVRTAIARAFHAEFVAPVEAGGDVRAAADAYGHDVHPVIGGLLAFCAPQDDPAVARCLVYRAWTTRDAAAAHRLVDAGLAADSALDLAPLLAEVIADAPDDDKDQDARLAAAFLEAFRRGDLRAMQALGGRIIARPGAPTTIDGQDIQEVLRRTLDVQPNPGLRDVLAEHDGANDARPRVESYGPVGPGNLGLPTTADVLDRGAAQRVELPALPQNWADFLTRVRARQWAAARSFLALDEGVRPPVDGLSDAEVESAVAALEELLTDPAFGQDLEGRRLAESCLPAFVEDFVTDPLYPQRGFGALYLQLLRLWGGQRQASIFAPDGQVLLTLAEGVLRDTADAQSEVADVLRAWWQARQVAARLPFLLEAIELLVDRTSELGAAQALWIEGITLAKQHASTLSHADRRLWRALGLRTGFDSATVDGELGPAPLHDTVDPLARIALRKVAIVSLHERAVAVARAQIAARTGAEVLVVTDMVAGAGTQAALQADVILFVWSATKHAVYRAFDGARERLEYVQGTGASSIVLALDRWASKRLDSGDEADVAARTA